MENDFIENLIAKRQADNARAKKEAPVETVETKNLPAENKTERKTLGTLAVQDIKIELDETKSYEEQAENIVNAMTVSNAVQNEETQKKLVDAKSEELKVKAGTKVVKAKTEAMEAERKLYEEVLETFGIYRHLPRWLMITLVIMLSPVYMLLVICIGIPIGSVKFFIDSLDNLLVRYEKVNDQTKPRVKVITWIALGLVIVAVICLTVLKIAKII